MHEKDLNLNQLEKAVKLNQEILISADNAQKSIWTMCTKLKEMRDGKLYKVLGYQNFEDYCENEVGIKRRCAYKYISIIENVQLENVHTCAQIGASKLALLATISGEQQQEISEKVNLEETTVKELKEEIDKLKTHNRDLGVAKDKAVAALTPLEDELRQLKSATDVLRTHLSEAESQTRTAKQELDTERARLNKTARDLQEAREANKELIKENNQLIDENEELRSRPTEVAIIDRPIDDDNPQLKEAIRILERENMKRNEEMDKQYLQDRRELEARKQAEINALRLEYEKKLADAAQPAEPMDEDKIKFKVYLTTAYSTFTQLIALASRKTEKIYTDRIKELCNNVLTNIGDKENETL